MEKLGTRQQEETLVDNLLKEAYEILSKSENLNDDREKLTGIFQQLASWKGDGNQDELYFEVYQKVILSMALLDFSKRLPISAETKSIQNLFSYSLNALNEELEDRVFPKALMLEMLKELQLKNTVVVGTNTLGAIKFFYTDREALFPPFKSFNDQNINIFFENMQGIIDLIKNKGVANGLKVDMKFGYKGTVDLRIANPSWLKIEEGFIFIIKLPENI